MSRRTAAWAAVPAWLRAGLRWVLGAALLYVGVEALFGRGRTASVLGIPFPVGVAFGILLYGAVVGMLYALLAFGLILVYRASRVISFVQAGLGVLPAVTGILLVTNHHVPFFVAVLVTLVGSALIGLLVDVVVMRRFSRAPRLIATVVTIGLGQLFAFLEFPLPGWIGGNASGLVGFPTPYSGAKVSIGGVVFSGDYLAIVVVTLLACIGLAAFFRYTRIGVAVRASAENADRAALLGVPVRRLLTVVWVLAAVLSGLAIFLRAPVVALPQGGSVSPTVLLFGLAAAVVGRMDSMPTAFAAGMAFGVMEQASVAGTTRPDLGTALMLPIVLVALLAQRQRLARAHDTGVATFRSLQEYRPIPTELRRLPEVVRSRAALGVLLAAIALGAPYLAGTGRANFCSLIVIYAMVGVSLVVLSGWAGQISLGQFAFAGVGAAVAGGLATRAHMDFFATLLIAGLAGAVLAVLIGIPALRVPGMFLAVVTLALAATVQYVVLTRDLFGWLLPPIDEAVGRPILYGRLDVRSDRAFYYVCLAFLVLAYASARALRRSRSGRVFIGIRDNIRAGQSYGISAAGTRLAAFAISGFIAAVAGALMAYQQQAVDQNTFGMLVSLEVFLFVVVGGLTSLPGGVLGAVFFGTLKYLGPRVGIPNLEAFATGPGVVLILLGLPGGLAGACYSARDGILRWVAKRRGLLVPSLVADRRATPEPAAADAHVLDVARRSVEAAGVAS